MQSQAGSGENKLVGKKVLIIDDSESVRTQVKYMLEPLGVDGLMAVNGEDGIQKIKENEDISLIFCDINMPQLDGISMLQKIKKENILLGGKHEIPPVVMLTTESTKSISQSAREAGAKGWIIKPLKQDVLESILDSFIAA